jgi:hypothetical protein
MRGVSRPVLLLLASYGLFACAKRHGPVGGQVDEPGEVEEPGAIGGTSAFLCPTGGTRRPVDPGGDTDLGAIGQAQDGARDLLRFSYTSVAHEDQPPRETTAALQVRAHSRTAVLVERPDLPDADACRTELQLDADLILLTGDNAFRDVFRGTLSRTSAGTRFFARAPGTPLQGSYAAPEDSEFRLETVLEVSEDEEGTPRESWTGRLWLELKQGKTERTMLAAHWSLLPDP